MKMDENITELANHSPTVESVISRLHRNMGKIKGITAVIEWDDGTTQICFDTCQTDRLAFDSILIQKYIMDSLND
jgi:hypothetical protein